MIATGTGSISSTRSAYIGVYPSTSFGMALQVYIFFNLKKTPMSN